MIEVVAGIFAIVYGAASIATGIQGLNSARLSDLHAGAHAVGGLFVAGWGIGAVLDRPWPLLVLLGGLVLVQIGSVSRPGWQRFVRAALATGIVLLAI